VNHEAGTVHGFARIAELTSAFYRWEERGRGWTVFPHAVELEPPFRPFLPERRQQIVIDDARTPSLIGRWLESLFGRRTPAIRPEVSEVGEPEPNEGCRHRVIEIQIALGPDIKVPADLAEHFLLSLTSLSAPASFEIVGTSEAITVQIACAAIDAPHVRDQARAYFPDAVILDTSGFLENTWREATGVTEVVDFGLSQEFMRPLKVFSKFDADPLIGLIGALGELHAGEAAVLQVLLQTAARPWQTQIMRSVSSIDGEPFFIDAPELLSLAQEKIARPLFAVAIRLAVKSPSRSWELVRRIGGTLAQFSRPDSNELVALDDTDYPKDAHIGAVLTRQTRRSGFLLNSEEVASIVHPPSISVRAPKLTRDHRRTKAVPKALLTGELVLGENTYAGVTNRVWVSAEQRLRHTHVVGASGTGKSTLLLNMFVQDMEAGRGCALIDPHGDLVDAVLSRVPDGRVNDVILIDPSDTERPVAFNILSAHSELEKTLLSSDLVAVFRRLSTSWGDQMTSVLSNAVLAFLESDRGGSLADLRRFLVEAEFRKAFLETVRDPEVVFFWQKEFPLLSGRPQAPLLTRLDAFLRPRLVRGMVAQSENRLDFASIMNEGKILLVKLAQGAIGEENATLLGTLFVSKIHQLALGRQAIDEGHRRPFYVYMDEFQHFVTTSMATLLTGARKYGVGLVLAHQELRQLWNQDRDVAGAVLANAATRVCFRVGDDDAKKLVEGFATFTARDLQNLGVGQAVCRVDRADSDFSLSTISPAYVSAACAEARRATTVSESRERYGSVAPEAAQPPALSSRLTTPTDRGNTLHHTSSSASPVEPRFGRGGSQHRYLQELIRRWADANGWRTTIEQPIFDGLGSVDVAIERQAHRIAIEISVASTTDYELSNIHKCIAAGFDRVLSVVTDKRAQSRLKQCLDEILGPVPHAIVDVLSPAQLFDFLNGLAANDLPVAGRTTRGYKVSVARASTSNRGKLAAQAIANTLVGALKRLQK
jgi:hypothetical protein